MQISEIMMSQRKLRAVEQLSDFISVLNNGGYLTPITLLRCQDDVIQVDDGHHRLCAIWLSGRRILEYGEYLIVESERNRPRFGLVTDLLDRCGITLEDP